MKQHNPHITWYFRRQFPNKDTWSVPYACISVLGVESDLQVKGGTLPYTVCISVLRIEFDLQVKGTTLPLLWARNVQESTVLGPPLWDYDFAGVISKYSIQGLRGEECN